MRTIPLSQLNHFCWNKQRLMPPASAQTVVAAANHVVGLHAARLSSPYVAAACRVANFTPSMLRQAWLNNRELVKLRCMRGTLHLLTHTNARHAHLATLRARETACRRTFATLGLSARKIDSTRARVIAELERAPASPNELERRLARAGVPVECSRAVLKHLWEQGVVALLDSATSWQSERRQFALTSRAYPGLQLGEGDRREARNQLVALYFRAFGPASLTDAAWWTGLGSKAVLMALEETGERLARVHVTERTSEEELILPEDQLDDLYTHEAAPLLWIQLLAHEDPSLKAYYGTRWRYVDQADYSQLFNAIGEARASIMIDGRYAGLWMWNRRDRSIELTLTRPVRKYHQRELSSCANKLTDILREELPQVDA